MKADVYYTYFDILLNILDCFCSLLQFVLFIRSLYFFFIIFLFPHENMKNDFVGRKKGIHVFNNIINHSNCFNDFNSFLSRSSLMVHFHSI